MSSSTHAIWTPGLAGPAEELVKRIQRRVEAFAEEHGIPQAEVSIELYDGSLHRLRSLSPEPGYGFISFCPHSEEGDAEELIVPLGAVREIRIGRADTEQPFGFVADSTSS